MKYKLAPSILSADFNILGEQIRTVALNGADYLHIDVMDGDFVPSISFGMPVIRSIRKQSEMFFDVHLMVRKPERYIEEFAKCGADGITIHLEATEDVEGTLKLIRSLGKKVGISINPETDVKEVLPYVELADMVLIMTVHPGFGGQKYIEECTAKIKEMRSCLNDRGLETDIQVDGGITRENIGIVTEAGANVIVMGSSVFRGDIAENTAYFRKVLDEK